MRVRRRGVLRRPRGRVRPGECVRAGAAFVRQTGFRVCAYAHFAVGVVARSKKVGVFHSHAQTAPPPLFNVFQDVAHKLGCEWRDLARVEENVRRYGQLRGHYGFRAGTLLRIPPRGSHCSNWKLRKLVRHTEARDGRILVACGACRRTEDPDDPDDPAMLLCDGCDGAWHAAPECSNLQTVPEGDWFCGACLETLRARRREHHGGKSGASDGGGVVGPSLVAPPEPPAPKLRLEAPLQDLADLAAKRLSTCLGAQRKAGLQVLERAQAERRVRHSINSQSGAICHFRRTLKASMERHNIEQWHGFNPRSDDRSLCSRPWDEFTAAARRARWVRVRTEDGIEMVSSHINFYDHERAVQSICGGLLREIRVPYGLAHRATRLEGELEAKLTEQRDLLKEQEIEREDMLIEYASLLGEPRLACETATMFRNREGPPSLMGFVKPRDDGDLEALRILLQPGDPAICLVPVDPKNAACDVVVPDVDYALYSRDALFDEDRDDSTPIDSDLRKAQRRLMALLLADRRNASVVISLAKVPSSVKLRGTTDDDNNDDEDASRCFDLSRLVHDCNCDLNLPKAATPARLADHGLELHTHQMASLRFMLDKEAESSSFGMGLAGELWSRLYFFDGRGTYYYCELTGAFSKNIFNYGAEAEQKIVAKNCGGFPTGGILGDE